MAVNRPAFAAESNHWRLSSQSTTWIMARKVDVRLRHDGGAALDTLTRSPLFL
jgi:hypothetical protein